jgi:hypothetical protein
MLMLTVSGDGAIRTLNFTGALDCSAFPPKSGNASQARWTSSQRAHKINDLMAHR